MNALILLQNYYTLLHKLLNTLYDTQNYMHYTCLHTYTYVVFYDTGACVAANLDIATTLFIF